ncbi:hypothetical protein G9A89_007993 [Geosiphon pyriformis]|nr:hypothetical protein G9A89_007993 [Geosiphon pyriformis]
MAYYVEPSKSMEGVLPTIIQPTEPNGQFHGPLPPPDFVRQPPASVTKESPETQIKIPNQSFLPLKALPSQLPEIRQESLEGKREAALVKRDRDSSRSRMRSRSRRHSPSKSHSRSHSPKRYGRASRRHRRRSPSKISSSRSRSGSRDRHQSSRSRRDRSLIRSKYSRDRSISRGRRRTRRDIRDEPEPSRVLGVFNLSLRTEERDLKHIFEQYGKVNEVIIVYDHRTERSRGFGFVYMDTISDATNAKEKTNAMELNGRNMRVDYSLTRKAHTPTPGEYMGGKFVHGLDHVVGQGTEVDLAAPAIPNVVLIAAPGGPAVILANMKKYIFSGVLPMSIYSSLEKSNVWDVFLVDISLGQNIEVIQS